MHPSETGGTRYTTLPSRGRVAVQNSGSRRLPLLPHLLVLPATTSFSHTTQYSTVCVPPSHHGSSRRITTPPPLLTPRRPSSGQSEPFTSPSKTIHHIETRLSSPFTNSNQNARTPGTHRQIVSRLLSDCHYRSRELTEPGQSRLPGNPCYGIPFPRPTGAMPFLRFPISDGLSCECLQQTCSFALLLFPTYPCRYNITHPPQRYRATLDTLRSSRQGTASAHTIFLQRETERTFNHQAPAACISLPPSHLEHHLRNKLRTGTVSSFSQ